MNANKNHPISNELLPLVRKWRKAIDAFVVREDYLRDRGLECDEDDKHSELLLDRLKIEDEIWSVINTMKDNLFHGLSKEDKILLIEFIQESASRGNNAIEAIDYFYATQKEVITKRYKELDFLITVKCFDGRVLYLYRQLVQCYAFGFFEASCSLCRTISEYIVKSRINDRGLGCKTKDKKPDTNFLMQICKNYNIARSEVIEKYKLLHEDVNKVLHEARLVDEKETRECIESLQNFIKEFFEEPKPPEGIFV